jgi:hypothetical protein
MAAEWIHKVDAIEDLHERERVSHAVEYATGTALMAGYETASFSMSADMSTVLIDIPDFLKPLYFLFLNGSPS